MKIATWNLRRPRRLDDRLKRLLKKIDEIDADIWILTETHLDARPSSQHECHTTRWLENKFGTAERRVIIWSRLPILDRVSDLDGDSTVAIEVQAPTCKLIVCGTIIPYGGAGSKCAYSMNGVERRAKGWELHCEAIAQNERSLLQIRAKYPDHAICFGGDFNQARNQPARGRYRYGTNKCRQLLTTSFERVQMQCITELDFVGMGHLASKSTIDHLCLTEPHWRSATRVSAWDSPVHAGKFDTDHNGVMIELTA